MNAGTTLDQWLAGERRFRACPPEQRHLAERIEDAIHRELRRRLGGSFTTAELIALYESGTAWCMALAVTRAPDVPWAWEPWLADAAFQRYLREAQDYAGGRVVRD